MTAPIDPHAEHTAPAPSPVTESALLVGRGVAAVQFPARFGKYLVLGVLGEGGMGTVYDAEQEQPHRRVALKTVRPELASDQARWRFARESQALGRLQHPGIAQIYEAGTVDGPFGPQPFFAMELVAGRPLTAYAATIPTRDRAALVAAVCDAVHYAHQRGVIHRDLKPANILVDDAGQPKVLDFGVARLTDADVQATTLTAAGEVIGTLAYMSPEQLSGDPLDIDVRCDVYALGVMLYEVLAGRRPYELAGRQLWDALRVIASQEPATLGRTDRRLRGDLEVIVAKALEKEPARRYQSAAALAADLRHHLNDEPITARPATAAYQFRKFARRNRALVLGAGLAAAALVAGTAVSSWQALRARAAERAATAAATRARQETAKAKAVNDFLQKMLASSNPYATGPRLLTVRDVLADAAKRLDSGALRRQPEVEGTVRETLGENYLQFGQLDSAAAQLDSAQASLARAYGPNAGELAPPVFARGQVQRQRGDLAGAGKLYTRGLALAGRPTPDNTSIVAHLEMSLAYVRYAEGKFDESIATGRRALALARTLDQRDADNRTLTTLATTNLASMLTFTERAAESLPLWAEAVATLRRTATPPDAVLANALMNSAYALFVVRRLPEAAAQAREALPQLRALYPDDPTQAANGTSRLGDILMAADSLDAAEPLLRETLAVRQKALGGAHADVQYARAALGKLLVRRKRWAEAESLLALALAGRRAVVGDRHPAVASTMDDLAAVAAGRGDQARAESLALGAAERWREAKLGRRELAATAAAARAALARGNAGRADSLLGDALARQQPAADTSLAMADAMEVAADVAAARGRPADVGRSLLRAEAALRGRPGDTATRRYGAVAGRLADYYERAGRAGEATAWRSRAVAVPRDDQRAR